MKKHFIVYENWSEMFVSLPDESAGKLIKAICKYKTTGEVVIDDDIIGAIFAMMKVALDEDAEKYRQKCERLCRNRMNSEKFKFLREKQEEKENAHTD